MSPCVASGHFVSYKHGTQKGLVLTPCPAFFRALPERNTARNQARHVRQIWLLQLTCLQRYFSLDCHACRFDRCVRAGLNMQEYGPTHNVLPRDRRGNTKWNLSGDCLPQRGLVPTASTSDILQKVVAATSARRVDEKKKPERNVVTSVGKPGINDNDNMKVVSSGQFVSF